MFLKDFSFYQLKQEPGRRDSRGRLLDAIPNQSRRSSFQGLSESVVSKISLNWLCKILVSNV